MLEVEDLVPDIIDELLPGVIGFVMLCVRTEVLFIILRFLNCCIGISSSFRGFAMIFPLSKHCYLYKYIYNFLTI